MELNVSNLIVIIGLIILMAIGKLEWYYGVLIIIYLLEFKYEDKLF